MESEWVGGEWVGAPTGEHGRGRPRRVREPDPSELDVSPELFPGFALRAPLVDRRRAVDHGKGVVRPLLPGEEGRKSGRGLADLEAGDDEGEEDNHHLAAGVGRAGNEAAWISTGACSGRGVVWAGGAGVGRQWVGGWVGRVRTLRCTLRSGSGCSRTTAPARLHDAHRNTKLSTRERA